MARKKNTSVTYTFLIFIALCAQVYPQNWFPLEVGNSWLYLSDTQNSYPSSQTYSSSKTTVTNDIMINAKRYFKISNFADYGNDFLYYYNVSSQILYGRLNDFEYPIVDFTKPKDAVYYQIAPDGGFRRAVIKQYNFDLLDSTFSCKGFSSNGSYYFAQNVGPVYNWVKLSTYVSQLNTAIDYFLHGFPSNSVHYKTTVDDKLKPIEFTSGHNNINGRIRPQHPYTFSGGLQFVEKIFVDWFYKKGSSIIEMNSLVSTYSPSSGFSFAGPAFNFDLLINGYSINYRLKVQTKYLFDNIEYFPDSGYYSIRYPRKTFLPFNPNNRWRYNEYYISSGYADSTLLRSYWLEENGDTIHMGMKSYFAVNNSLTDIKTYYRFPLNDPRLFLFDSTVTGLEYVIENVDSSLHAVLPDSRFGQNHAVEFVALSLSDKFHLNSEERTYSSQTAAGTYYIIKDSLGLIYEKRLLNNPLYNEWKSIVLQEAYINGRHFITDVVGIADENITTEFKLFQNYPNPFNPSTKIRYSIPFVETHSGAAPQNVLLKVYDVLGNEIAILVNEEKSPGEYEVEFDGKELASGIYFYRLKAGSNVISKKMVVLK